MFSFFHRTPKIELDCFINNKYVYDTTPIVNAHKTYPKWWLDLPLGIKRNFDYNLLNNTDIDIMNEVQTNNNMKNCYGFLEFFKRGAVIESWAEFKFKVGPAGFKYFCSSGPTPVNHNEKQKGEGFKDYHHTKLINPWVFSPNQEVMFLFMPAIWNLENYNIVIPPGVLNFDITSIAHINILMPKVSKEFEIPIGQPLVHLIPLSEKKLKINNHLVTQEEYNRKMFLVANSFYGWRKKLELLNRNKERDNNKCPFH